MRLFFIIAIFISIVFAVSIENPDDNLVKEKSGGLIGYFKSFWNSKRSKIIQLKEKDFKLENTVEKEVILENIDEKEVMLENLDEIEDSPIAAAIFSASEQSIPVSYHVQMEDGHFVYRLAKVQEPSSPHALDL